MLQGYGPDAVASAINTLESTSRKGVQEAMQKAGHSLPAASMNATAGAPRAASGAAQMYHTVCFICFNFARSCLQLQLAFLRHMPLFWNTSCHLLSKDHHAPGCLR